MGGYRVYQGKGNPNQCHMRGSLVQTVSGNLSVNIFLEGQKTGGFYSTQ